MLEQIMIT